jgi:hypothetical protein
MGRVRTVALAIASALTLASMPVRAAPQAGGEPEPSSASATDAVIAVEMAASVERGEALAEKISQEGARLLQAHRLPAEVDAADPKRVLIRVSGTDYDWSVAVSVEKAGEVLRALDPAKCECTKEELIDRAMQGVVDLLPVLRGEDDAGTPPPPSTNGGDRPTKGERKRLGAPGKAGVALIVLGAAGAIAGAVLLGLGRRDEDANPQMRDEVSYTAPGGAVLGVGLAVLVVGAILVGVDRSRARKRAALLPIVTPRWAGIGLRMKF